MNRVEICIEELKILLNGECRSKSQEEIFFLKVLLRVDTIELLVPFVRSFARSFLSSVPLFPLPKIHFQGTKQRVVSTFSSRTVLEQETRGTEREISFSA